MSRTWGHSLRVLSQKEIDADARAGWTTCNVPRCINPRSHVASYQYITGRAGRQSSADKAMCSGHAAKFAKQHGLRYEGPKPLPLPDLPKRTFQICPACGRRGLNLVVLPIEATAKRWSGALKNFEQVPIPAGSRVHRLDHILLKQSVANELGILAAIFNADPTKLIGTTVWEVLYKLKEKPTGEVDSAASDQCPA